MEKIRNGYRIFVGKPLGAVGRCKDSIKVDLGETVFICRWTMYALEELKLGVQLP
jgi:hypothetical protein